MITNATNPSNENPNLQTKEPSQAKRDRDLLSNWLTEGYNPTVSYTGIIAILVYKDRKCRHCKNNSGKIGFDSDGRVFEACTACDRSRNLHWLRYVKGEIRLQPEYEDDEDGNVRLRPEYVIGENGKPVLRRV